MKIKNLKPICRFPHQPPTAALQSSLSANLDATACIGAGPLSLAHSLQLPSHRLHLAHLGRKVLDGLKCQTLEQFKWRASGVYLSVQLPAA